MNYDRHFTKQRPFNGFLSTIIDYYFFIDTTVEELQLQKEAILPFPRLNFLYFFGHPFEITNHTQQQSMLVRMGISRMTTDQISVRPITDRVKILGAHVLPHCLAYLAEQPINELPWMIDTEALFKDIAVDFRKRIEHCRTVEQMFAQVEKTFLDNILVRDLSLISKAIEIVEKRSGDIRVQDLSACLGVTDRTIRNHFFDYIGCAPKEYIRLVKLRQVAYQMKHSKNSLTDIAYGNSYSDQAHFIRDVKNATGRSPKQLKKEIAGFRFLQF